LQDGEGGLLILLPALISLVELKPKYEGRREGITRFLEEASLYSISQKTEQQ